MHWAPELASWVGRATKSSSMMRILDQRKNLSYNYVAWKIQNKKSANQNSNKQFLTSKTSRNSIGDLAMAVQSAFVAEENNEVIKSNS